MTPDQAPLTLAQTRLLAADLVTQLSATPGDSAAVTATLMRWTDTLDPPQMALICMAAVRLTFADCLTRVAQVPPGALALNPPTERNAA